MFTRQKNTFLSHTFLKVRKQLCRRDSVLSLPGVCKQESVFAEPLNNGGQKGNVKGGLWVKDPDPEDLH